jgi:dTDP-4-dehydrorhamnose 3,5-epimerase
MRILPTRIGGLSIIELDLFQDSRGHFLESYQESRYFQLGITDVFVQDNLSRTTQNVLRGLHFQIENPQAQLVTLVQGHIFDVCVDLRKNSDTFGMWVGIELSESGPRQIHMAPGLAHGFCVLSPWADLHYKVTRKYDASDENGIIWNDPELAINWPIINPIIGERDCSFMKLSEIEVSKLPKNMN